MRYRPALLLCVVVTLLGSDSSSLVAGDTFHWPDGKRVAVSLSFDDARPSQVDNGVPLLQKHGVKATFYVSAKAVRARLEEWKRVVALGHEIGNHSSSHPCTINYTFSRKNALEDYTLARMAKNLDDAGAEVEQLLGVKPLTFAYPCGQKFVGRGTEVKSYVPLVAARFLAGRGYLNESANDPERCDLAQVMGTGMDELDAKTLLRLVVSAAAEGRWLVLVGHDVGAPARQTTDSAALEQLLQFAKDPANGIWIDTVAAVSKYITKQRALPAGVVK